MADQPTIDVVIPTHNRAEQVCECVEALLNGSFRDFRVTIVDDASTDHTQSLVASRLLKDQRVRYCRNKRCLRQACSRNIGARLTTARLIFFLDDDNLPAPDCLEQLASCAENHPEFGLIAPLAIQEHGALIWTLGSSFDFWTSRPLNVGANQPVASFKIDRELYPTMYSPNAFMVTREAWEAVKGFDQAFRITYEESDFGYRMMAAGFKGAIYPKARTLHRSALSPGQVMRLRRLGIETPDRAWYFARNRSEFIRRYAKWYQKPVALGVFTPLSAVIYSAIALACGVPSVAWAYWGGLFMACSTGWCQTILTGVKSLEIATLRNNS